MYITRNSTLNIDDSSQQHQVPINRHIAITKSESGFNYVCNWMLRLRYDVWRDARSICCGMKEWTTQVRRMTAADLGPITRPLALWTQYTIGRMYSEHRRGTLARRIYIWSGPKSTSMSYYGHPPAAWIEYMIKGKRSFVSIHMYFAIFDRNY